MKKSNSYFWLSLINILVTVVLVVFVWTTIFPNSTIEQNGDITFNVWGLIVDHVEVQQFETNVETLDTELVYWVEPIDLGETKITISNEAITDINRVLFNDGVECKITFGEVIAIPRLGAIYIVGMLYIILTLYLIPYLFKKKFP